MKKKTGKEVKWLPETSQLIEVGKVKFGIYGDEGNYDCYRLVRGCWQLLGTTETYSGARSLVLNYACKTTANVDLMELPFVKPLSRRGVK